MLKPPAATLPGMTDTLDFVKNLWGSMNLPGTNMSGMSAPPLSAEDLDKRIADMKAVETWLNLNLTMLRGTIQTMEVQRSTLATLQSMGASMAEAMRQSGVSAEKMAGTPFASFFGQPAAGSAGATAPARDQAQDPAASLGMPAAMAWWNTLQDQFTQAVTMAMAPPDGAAMAKPQDDAPASQASAPDASASAANAPKPAAGTQSPGTQAAGPSSGGNGRARNNKPKDKA